MVRGALGCAWLVLVLVASCSNGRPGCTGAACTDAGTDPGTDAPSGSDTGGPVDSGGRTDTGATIYCGRSSVATHECSCRTRPPPLDNPIDSCRAMPNGWCCASATYPGDATGCECFVWGCDEAVADDDRGCLCGRGFPTDAPGCSPAPGADVLCCAHDTHCECRPRRFMPACDPGGVVVPHCNVEQADCTGSERVVTACL